jgi:hypothetical protein
MKFNKKQIQEWKRLEEHRWNNSLAGKLHKKHKEVFGVEPKFFGESNSGTDVYLDAIRDAIRNGKPLDQYEELTPEMKSLWEQDLIEID